MGCVPQKCDVPMAQNLHRPCSSGATGAAHNSDCHVGRGLLLPVTKKNSTLQSVMSRLRKREIQVTPAYACSVFFYPRIYKTFYCDRTPGIMCCCGWKVFLDRLFVEWAACSF